MIFSNLRLFCLPNRAVFTLATVAICILASENDVIKRENVTKQTARTNDVVCGTKFHDTASSTYLAHSVIIAKVDRAAAANTSSQFLYRLLVQKNVKPVTSSTGDRKMTSLIVGRFAAKQNKMACVSAKLKIGGVYIFYLKKRAEPAEGGGAGKYAEISAMPELVTEKKVKSMMGIVCERKKCGTPANVSLSPPLEEVSNFLEESVELVCSYSGRPTPQIVWYKDGQPFNKRSLVRHYPNNKTSSVLIDKLSITHAGQYTCEASNVFSSAKKSVNLKVMKAHSTLCPGERQKLCFNGGTCYIHSGKEYCHCPIEYEGSRCQKFNLEVRKNEEAPKTLVAKERVIMIGLLMAIIILTAALLFVIIRCWSINKRLTRLEKSALKDGGSIHPPTQASPTSPFAPPTQPLSARSSNRNSGQPMSPQFADQMTEVLVVRPLNVAAPTYQPIRTRLHASTSPSQQHLQQQQQDAASPQQICQPNHVTNRDASQPPARLSFPQLKRPTKLFQNSNCRDVTAADDVTKHRLLNNDSNANHRDLRTANS